MDRRKHLISAAILAAAPAASILAGSSSLDDPRQLLDFYLEIEPAEWDALRRQADFTDDENFNPEHPALFRCGDEEPLAVHVRRKRLLALPSEADPRKVSIQVDFDDLVEDQEWHGRRKINLENGAGGTLLSEGIAWQLMARAGAIASGSSWVRLHVNGEPAGVFTRVDAIDRSFLYRQLREDGGFLYRGERQVTRVGESDAFAAFLCYPPFASACPAPEEYAGLAQRCDVRQLLTVAAVDAYCANWDSLFGLGNNYWWYSSARPRLYLPWDLDQAMGSDPRSSPRGDPHDVLPGVRGFDALLGTPWLRAYFDAELSRLVDGALHPNTLDALLADIDAAVSPAVDADPQNGLPGSARAEIERLRAWFHGRDAVVRRLQPAAAPGAVVINEILAANTTYASDEGGEHADWVEIYNRGTAAAPLAGLYLSDDPARPIRWPLPSLELHSGAHLLVWCDHDVGEGPFHTGFQLDAEGEAVALYRAADGVVATVDLVRFARQTTDRSLGRVPDGAPGLVPIDCPTPGAANPATCESEDPRFRRGDADKDGRITIADTVSVLRHLFAGAPLACADAGDTGDDGQIDVADAVDVATYLFRAGVTPAAPYPECGRDPTSDALGCAAAHRCR